MEKRKRGRPRGSKDSKPRLFEARRYGALALHSLAVIAAKCDGMAACTPLRRFCSVATGKSLTGQGAKQFVGGGEGGGKL